MFRHVNLNIRQKIDRLGYIIHQVNLHNKVLLDDLSEQLQVSNDTIKRISTRLKRSLGFLKAE